MQRSRYSKKWLKQSPSNSTFNQKKHQILLLDVLQRSQYTKHTSKEIEIETVFDSYKNFLKADLMYMQNRYVLEGWLTSNFIAMIAYHKLYTRLRLVKKLNKYSPKDIIEISKSIYKLKINNEWKVSEVVKKNQRSLQTHEYRLPKF